MRATAAELMAQTRVAADADRQVREAGLADTLRAVQPSPLLSVTNAMAQFPLISRSAEKLNPLQIANDLAAGKGVAELALRLGFSTLDGNRHHPAGGNLAEPVAKVIREELSLSEAASGAVAARFVGTYLLLDFVTTAQRYFSAESIAEATTELGGQAGALAKFACAFWAGHD